MRENRDESRYSAINLVTPLCVPKTPSALISLKRFLSKHFDQQFLDRKKGGFSLPLQHWFSEGGALRQELKDRFLLGAARIHRYLRPDVVKELVTEHVQTRKSSQTLWQLLFLENWLEHVHDAAMQAQAISQRIVVLQ